jgi:hypothetical protein
VWGRGPPISVGAGDAEPVAAGDAGFVGDVERPKRKHRGSLRR